ncbi:glycogen synthase GlgA [Methylosoma difficile]
MKKILFVASEAHPLIKTGGLADVAGSLPKALAELGQDIRILLPNYQAISSRGDIRYLCSLRVDNRNINLLETRIAGTDVLAWLIDYPAFFNYPGNPYLDANGEAWPNNDERFALFCKVAVEVAMNRIKQDWQPDIVHCNDWQTGLVPALLSLEDNRPASVFTLHNLAYQGVFPPESVGTLNIPSQLWQPEGLEFHQMLSFMKGGLVYADALTTVSPTYAQEIQTETYGCGLEGLLSYRHDKLIGILNGIDNDDWNPTTDDYLAANYSADQLAAQKTNKAALQQQMGLPVDDSIPVFGLISRLVEQKGIDLVIDCLPAALTMPMQFILLGAGDKSFESQLQNLAQQYPDKIAITLGYNEALAHQIEAGADVFLMPSRFEPCGLNQMYSQRYGTLPIVRKTGGLADTVVDAIPQNLANQTATGLVFSEASSGALLETIKRAITLYSLPNVWENMQQQAMQKDFSWQRSATQYLEVYGQISPNP